MNLKLTCFALAIAVGSAVSYAAPLPNHLLLTEVAVSGGRYTNGSQSSEYTEIYNPTGTAVSLDRYYTTDWSRYWDYPYVSTYDATNFPKEGGGDYIVKFPLSYQIPAGGVVVVTAHAQYFLDAYFGGDLNAFLNQPGSPQLFEITSSRPDVPDMIDLNLDSLADPTLKNQSHSDAGENIFLFYWDGQSDLVKDVDIVFYAAEKAVLGNDNGLYTKSGVASEGPDPDGNLTNYLVDNGTEANLAVRNGSGVRFSQIARRSIFEIGEVQSGGNGLLGSDETMERCNISWHGFPNTDSTATPGVLPAELTNANKAPVMYAKRLGSSTPAPGSPVTISAQILDDGTITSASVLVNTGSGFTSKALASVGNDTWETTIGPFTDGQLVTWFVIASDNTGLVRSELDYKYLGSNFAGHKFRVDAVPVTDADLFFSEIMFDPQGTDNGTNTEFVEIYNNRSTPIQLGGYEFVLNSQPPITIPEGTVIQPKGYVILVGNMTLFVSKLHPAFDSSPLVDLGYDDWASVLTNGNSTINLRQLNDVSDDGSPNGDVFETVRYYSNEAPWPPSAAGTGAGNLGYSLELKNASAQPDNADGANWGVSTNLGGSPGKKNTVDNAGNLTVTPAVRAMEFPTSTQAIALATNVTSSNPISSVKLRVNTGSGYTEQNMTNGGGGNYTASIGPFPNGTLVKYYVVAQDSSGMSVAAPYVSPTVFYVDDNIASTIADIVVTEVMYNNTGTDNATNSEWIEVYNRRATPINLSFFKWGNYATSPNARVIPEGMVIPGNGFVILAGKKERIPVQYPYIDMNTVVDAHWTSGSSILQNSTGVSESRDVPLVHANSVNWNGTNVPFDIVKFDVILPWPVTVDGYSIELLDPSSDNTVASNWRLSPNKNGSPAIVNVPPASVKDWSVY